MRPALCPIAPAWAVIFATASFVAISSARAAGYYFDSVAGSDVNPGTSAERPFQSLAKLARLDLKPGDVVRFRRGATFRGQLRFQGNGTEGNPIRLTAYGEGAKPEILGSIRPKEWEHHRGQVYRLRLPKESLVGDRRAVYGVFDYAPGRVPVRLERGSTFDKLSAAVLSTRRGGQASKFTRWGGRGRKSIPSRRGSFFFDKKSRFLYVITPDGKPPSGHHLEVSVVTPLVAMEGRSWIVIEGLALLFGNCMHVAFRDSHDVIVRDCASLFVGSYGNPNVVIVGRSTRIKVTGCFLYENANGAVYISDGSTRCVISGCTIAKCMSNDGVTIHSGGRDKQGVRQRLAGDHNVIEGNVIGLCPEESIDITSGDHHVVRGNICYGDGNPGIIVGHDSDHILIENNICFGNKRAGIHISGSEKEGARGGNRVVRNLVYGNGYPGLEIQARNTQVFNNTVVNSRDRVGVRISEKGRGSVLRNNLVVTLAPEIRHANLQFLGGTPVSFDVKLDHNMFFHVAKPDGRVLETREGKFTPAEFLAKYGTGAEGLVAEPRFVSEGDRYYFLAPGSPGIDAGADVGLPFAGEAPDVGWKERGSEGTAPRYPPVLIDGGDDEAAILYLWGKTEGPPRGEALHPRGARPEQERTLELPDQTVRLETVYEDDFSRDTGDWLAEGGARPEVRGGRLFFDAYRGRPQYATIWCRREFQGDAVIEYTARVEEGEGNTNMNFFIYGTNPDGSSVLETTGSRTGKYSEYHGLNNYILTYLNTNESGGQDVNRSPGEALRTRVRFRRDPGFNLVGEVWRREPIEKGRDCRFVIAIQGPRIRVYVDGALVVDYEDRDEPHRRGHHAFRTWKSRIGVDLFRVSRIVSATPRTGRGGHE